MPKNGVKLLPNRYMKNWKRVILASVIVLLAAVTVMLLLRQFPKPQAHEFNGMFVRGACHGHLYQTQEEGHPV